MIKILKKTVLIYFFINLVSTSFGNENFFDKGLELYKNKKYDDARFMFEPDNEEAILMLMKIALEKSNYSKVKDLSNTFTKVCKKLCEDNKDILETLENIEPKNDS